jgi:hypothetical protein
MRRVSSFLAFLPAILVAQQAPIGIVRGDLVTWQATAGAGQLSLKLLDGHVYECSFDPKTYFERDNQRVTAGAMAVGDRLEIVSDRKPASQNCYARTVHVMDAASINLSPTARQRFRRTPSPTESFAPRGDLTFSGVVLRLDGNRLMLKTRSEGEKSILLRSDTRYIGDGQRVEVDSLKTNTRVFIRAGRNLDDDIEAYQIVWGKIVQPD